LSINESNFSDDESSNDDLERPDEDPQNDIEIVPLMDDDAPAMAELATPNAASGANHNPYRDRDAYAPPPLDLGSELKNLSATGGAVGSFVLGIWSIISALITFFAFINAGLAILLGLYGLGSGRKKLAIAGIALGVVGLFMSFMEISEWVGNSISEAEQAEFEGI